MTAKQFVLERYPSAYSRISTSYVLILSGTNRIIGRGETHHIAWENAKAKIEEMEKKNE